MRKNILFILLMMVVLSCSQQKDYYPEKKPEMSDEVYKRCIEKLKVGYDDKDYYAIAFYIATLQGDRGLLKANLEKAFAKDSNFCYTLYQVKKDTEFGFFQTIYRYDTTLFNVYFNKCDNRMGAQSFKEFGNSYNLEIAKSKEQEPQIDSTKINIPLIAELSKIYQTDQMLRKKLTGMNISHQDEKRWLFSQDSIDLINLKKIDSILTRDGYPQPESVGYDLSRVPFLVIHHQSEVGIRMKYRKILDQNSSSNQMILFDRVTSDIKNY